MATYLPKVTEIKRQWRVIDCAGQPVGRLATQIADALRGKDRPTYTPHMDTGDFVVALNVEKVLLTGNKEEKKTYWRHSGFPGGIRGVSAAEMRAKHPEEILRKAVKGMLPRNRLAQGMLTKLKLVVGNEHHFQAQLAGNTPAA